MNEFVVIFRDEGDNLDWGRVSAGSLTEARKYGREFGAVKLIFPLSDLTNILHGNDPQSGRVDADVFNFIHEVSSSIKFSARIASSASSSYAGFWISPSYEVFSISEVTHVQFIWDNPELFGVSSKGKDFQYIQERVVDDVVGSGWVRVRVTNCVYISISASSKLPRRLSEIANILINENVPSGFYAGVTVFNRDGTYRHFNERLSVLLSEDSQMLSASIKPLVIRVSSSVNSDHISKAVTTVKRFLDNVGAWYKHHKSKKSGSEYFLVERPDDRLSPEVDVRVLDHNLPYMYDQPDLDVDPDSPARSGSYSVPEALDLLEGFFDGDYSNIVDGEPIGASRKPYTSLYSGRSGGILSGMQIDNSIASWISPDGEFIGTHGSHTSTVMENPERFGLTKEEADSLFSQGEEEAIITHLLDEGWIRIRNQFNFILISIGSLTSTVKLHLSEWSYEVYKDEDFPVILDISASGKSQRLLLRDFQNGIFSGKRFSLDGQVKDEYALWSVLKSYTPLHSKASISSNNITVYHGTTSKINRFSVSIAGEGGGKGLGWSGYGISFTKKPSLAFSYADGGRIYKVVLQASLDNFLHLDKPLSSQAVSVQVAVKCAFPNIKQEEWGNSGAGFLEGRSKNSMADKSVCLRLVRQGVVGGQDSDGFFLVWDDNIIKIIAVAELGGQGKSDDSLSADDMVIDSIVKHHLGAINDGKSTLAKAESAILKADPDDKEFTNSVILKLREAVGAGSSVIPALTFVPVASSYTPLHSRHNGRIISSIVPKVNVGNPVIQKMVDEVSAVLRGVDDKYFPRITYENALLRGEQYILFFVAEGHGFKVGVVCGTDGFISKVLFVHEDGYKAAPLQVKSSNHLRQMIDFAGSVLSRRR